MTKNKKILIGVSSGIGAVTLITSIAVPIAIDNNNIEIDLNNSKKIHSILNNLKNELQFDNSNIDLTLTKLNTLDTTNFIKGKLNANGGEISEFSKIINDIVFSFNNKQKGTFNVTFIINLPKNIKLNVRQNSLFNYDKDNSTLTLKEPISLINYDFFNPIELIDTINNYLNPTNKSDKTYDNFIELINNENNINKLIQKINNSLITSNNGKIVNISFEIKQKNEWPNSFDVFFTLTSDSEIVDEKLNSYFKLSTNLKSITNIVPLSVDNLYYELKSSEVVNLDVVKDNLIHFSTIDNVINNLNSIENIKNIALNNAINEKYVNLELIENTQAIDINNFNIKITLLFNNGLYTNIITNICNFKDENIKNDFLYADEQKTIISGLSGTGKLKNVLIIPQGVKEINAGAFDVVKNSLNSIYFPNSIINLNCNIESFKLLETIYFEENSNITSLKALGSFCPQLNFVVLPDSLTTLENCFNQAPLLNNIQLPNTITKINGFSYSGLTEIFIPENCYIYKFGVTNNLLEISFDPNYQLKNLDTHIFEAPNCKKITFPKNGIISNENCYNNFNNLEEIVFPYGLTSDATFELGLNSFNNVSSNVEYLNINLLDCTNLTNDEYQTIKSKIENSFSSISSKLNFIPPKTFNAKYNLLTYNNFLKINNYSLITYYSIKTKK